MDRTTRVLIVGAAERNFHNFNVVYCDDPGCEVVAFTAAQIPGIAGRRYPSALAGPRYPDGIPIVAEEELEAVCRARKVDLVVFAYSDVPHVHVMHVAAQAEADIILWDGGNNDFPFLRPDLHLVLVDPLRPGDETAYHLGEAVLRMANVVLVAKSNAAAADVERVMAAARRARYEFAEIESPGLGEIIDAFIVSFR